MTIIDLLKYYAVILVFTILIPILIGLGVCALIKGAPKDLELDFTKGFDTALIILIIYQLMLIYNAVGGTP